MKAFLDTSVLVATFTRIMSTIRPASISSCASRKKDACCGAHSLAEVYATLTGMPGKRRVSVDEGLLFLGNIRERLTLVALDEQEYFQMAEASAAANLASGAIYDAILGHCALKPKPRSSTHGTSRIFLRLPRAIADRKRIPNAFHKDIYHKLLSRPFALVRINVLYCSISLFGDAMPAKPRWYSELDRILAELRALPRPWVDRATVELLLQVGPRRAQQIMAPCVTSTIGASALADREHFIVYLAELARRDGAFYEQRRRRKVGGEIERLHRQAVEQPRLLVEAPQAVVNQSVDRLPDGIHLEPGRISVEFMNLAQALEKLLALAMAIGNNPEGFERLTRVPP